MRLAACALFVIAGLEAGCGSSKKSAHGSIPVKGIRVPTKTTTYEMRSVAMEPTLHCAEGFDCEGQAADRIVAEAPVLNVSTEDVVFRAPPLAQTRCGHGGLYVQRVIGLPGEKVAEKPGGLMSPQSPLPLRRPWEGCAHRQLSRKS